MQTTHATSAFEYVSPEDLVLEENIRLVEGADDDLVQSIRYYGVLEPIVARRREDGTLVVRMGQRRTLAARKAKLGQVPVYITAAGDEATTRILTQFAENEHRSGLTPRERLNALHQLTLEGMDVEKIARRTRIKREEVEAAVKIANSEHADVAPIEMGDLTLAAEILEFADDPDTYGYLMREIEDGVDAHRIRYVLARYQADRRYTEAAEQLGKELTEQGYTVTTQTPDYFDAIRPLHRLSRTEAAPFEDVTEDDVRTDAPRYAIIRRDWQTDQATWSLYIDPREHGLYFREDTGKVVENPLDDDGKRAERRRVIENNKDWRAAEIVRREWVTALVNRKQLPKDANSTAVGWMVAFPNELTNAVHKSHDVARIFLNLEKRVYPGADPLTTYTSRPGTSDRTLFALMLGALEGSLSTETWRSPTAPAAAYLAALSDWGYTLSDIEQGVIDAIKKRNEARNAA